MSEDDTQSIHRFKRSIIMTSTTTTTMSNPIRFYNILNHPDRGPKVEYSLNRRTEIYTDIDVDGWELRASRRALANIKTLLSQSAMLDLVQSQCKQGDVYFKRLVDSSSNQWRECTTDMYITGLKANDIASTRKKWLEDEGAYQRRMINIHPEHYAIPHLDGQEGVVEVIGEHMARLRIVVTDDVPAFVMEFGDPMFEVKKPTIAKLHDGTPVFYILHEFRDTEAGCHLRLRLIFPAEAPEVFFKEHAEHLAIEFRAGVWMVYEEVKASKQ